MCDTFERYVASGIVRPDEACFYTSPDRRPLDDAQSTSTSSGGGDIQSQRPELCVKARYVRTQQCNSVVAQSSGGRTTRTRTIRQ
jgi:hypothetical protein